MTDVTQQIVDVITNPTPATATLGSVSLVNIFVGGLPVFINVMMAIYVVLLVSHKGYQMWKEWKQRNESCK